MNKNLNIALEEKISLKAINIGFDLVGIYNDISCDHFSHYKNWIKHGLYGTMAYMAKNINKRESLNNILPGAKSIISCGLNYYNKTNKNITRGIISTYAQNKDYHKLITKKLKVLSSYIKELVPGVGLRYYCDTGPILEKYYAQKAGIGWIGKNTCLINKKFGSWIFLAEIITDIPLIPNIPAKNYCGKCIKCIEACPTKAITPYKLNARKCISYLTIESKIGIPKKLRHKFSGYVFGCDICQDVCPWNKKPIITNVIDLKSNRQMSLSEWLSINEQDFNSIFNHSPIKRRGFRCFMLNVIIGAGNSGNYSYIPMLKALLNNNDRYINSYIVWAINKLSSKI